MILKKKLENPQATINNKDLEDQWKEKVAFRHKMSKSNKNSTSSLNNAPKLSTK